MNDGPRVWKWLVPAAVMCAMPPMAMYVSALAEMNAWPSLVFCNYFLIGLMPILAVQAWAAFGAYYRHLDVDDLTQKRNATSTTAETRLFEYARSMHPETVRLLLLQRKLIWRIKEAKPGEMVDWVLDADPRVHVTFVEYLLKNSNNYAMMPINRLSDGSYSFDSEKLVTDRDQYAAFHRILINRNMATEAHGNMPGQWIEPWNPEIAAARWGIKLYEDEVEVSEKEEVKSEKVPAAAAVKPVRTEDVLTDAEAEKIREVEQEHTKRWSMTVKQYYLQNKKEK